MKEEIDLKIEKLQKNNTNVKYYHRVGECNFFSLKLEDTGANVTY